MSSAIANGIVAGAATAAIAKVAANKDNKTAATFGLLAGAGVAAISFFAFPAKKKSSPELVVETWKIVKANFELEQVGKMFYERLFKNHPSLKENDFKNTNMNIQPKSLMTSVDKMVTMLEKGEMEKLEKYLIAMGQRHVAYLTQEAQYPVVGENLLATLQAGLGEKFTPEVKQAWTDIYGVISSKMIEGQRLKECSNKAKARSELDQTTRLVVDSWKVVTDSFTFEEVGKLFYTRLFEKHPDLKDAIFGKTDFGMQPRALISSIDTCVKFLEKGQMQMLENHLFALGQRHVRYGTEEAHYPVVGENFLAVLEQGLGDKFTPEVKKAWADVYGIIASKMIEGQKSKCPLA